jgi:hypothetical protein
MKCVSQAVVVSFFFRRQTTFVGFVRQFIKAILRRRIRPHRYDALRHFRRETVGERIENSVEYGGRCAHKHILPFFATGGEQRFDRVSSKFLSADRELIY